MRAKTGPWLRCNDYLLKLTTTFDYVLVEVLPKVVDVLQLGRLLAQQLGGESARGMRVANCHVSSCRATMQLGVG